MTLTQKLMSLVVNDTKKRSQNPGFFVVKLGVMCI
jgi:hypothetical protein